MTPEERIALIKRNSQEIITEDELRLLLKEKHPSVYLGTAITGRPHIGYFLWVIKLGDFLKAGFKVKLLLADLHGALDQTPWELLEARYEYYSMIIPLMFKAIGQDLRGFEIVRGSNIQLRADYFRDVLKMATVASAHDCKKASSEVVKQTDNPKLAGLVYPIMQALDEEYLGVDVQCGGLDQRKILMFAREYLPKVGYKRRVEFMTPMIPGLQGSKMSASEESSKIDLLDSAEVVRHKINKANCPEGVLEDNGILAFTRYVIFSVKSDLIIERPEKWGGNLSYDDYHSLEKDFVNKALHPQDLKNAVAREINNLLEPIRKGADPKKAY